MRTMVAAFLAWGQGAGRDRALMVAARLYVSPESAGVEIAFV